MKKDIFGRGFLHCLTLFAFHIDNWASEERADAILSREQQLGLWINGASDHLYGLEIPSNLPKKLAQRISNFQKKVIAHGHGMEVLKGITEEQYQEIKEELLLIMRLLDKQYGVRTKIAEYK